MGKLYNFMVKIHKLDFYATHYSYYHTEFKPKEEYRISDFIYYFPSAILYLIAVSIDKIISKIKINKVIAKNDEKKTN